MMKQSAERLLALRRKVAVIERPRICERLDVISLGHGEIDAALGGGLARGHLHEVFAPEPGDASSTAGFAAMLAARAGGSIVWLRQEEAQKRGGRLHGPGLVEIGIDPARLILATLPDAAALLKAAADAARCTEIGMVVLEVWRMPRVLDLTASRRLALAARTSGVSVVMLRVDAEAMPSAAQTRWSAASTASMPFEAGAPGLPALAIELVRQRSGPAGKRWFVEWNRDRTCFNTPARGQAIPGAVPSLPVHGQVAAFRHVA